MFWGREVKTTVLPSNTDPCRKSGRETATARARPSSAPGYLRRSANGSDTPGLPAARSDSYSVLTFPMCSRTCELSVPAARLTRSFCPGIANDKLPARQVNILIPQLQTFGDPHPGSIEHRRDQPDRSVQPREHGLHFGATQHDGKMDGTLGAHDVCKPGHSSPSASRYRNSTAARGLVLRGCPRLYCLRPARSEMHQPRQRQAREDFSVHGTRETPDPVDVSFLSVLKAK